MKTQTTHSVKCRMAFGRPTKTDGDCPRCDELRNGAQPRQGWSRNKRAFEAASFHGIRHHSCTANGCGTVCTFGEW